MVSNRQERAMIEDRVATLEARSRTLELRVRTLERGLQGSESAAEAVVAPAPARPETVTAAPARPEAVVAAGPVRPETVTAAARASLEPPPPRDPARGRSVAEIFAAGPAPARATPRARPQRQAVSLEDFLGGSVLAWLGGVAVLGGLAFLLTVAISRGWLGEGARTLIAGALSVALLGLGARLRERRGRNDAALAAAAAGVAGCFGTLVVAAQVYDLVPAAVAMAGALAVGGVATALAIRWRAQAFGWLGLLGALLAPAVVGDGGSAFLLVAYAATVAVLVWRRWTALGFVAFAVVTPQWFFWLSSLGIEDGFQVTAGAAACVLAMTAFGALTTVAAVGFELRRHMKRVRVSAVFLLVLDAIVLDAAGRALLHGPAATGWLVAVAAAHLAVGLAGTRLSRVSHELALTALGLGVILADIAFAALTSGLPLVLGWAAGAVSFGALLGHRRSPTRADGAGIDARLDVTAPTVRATGALRRRAAAGFGLLDPRAAGGRAATGFAALFPPRAGFAALLPRADGVHLAGLFTRREDDKPGARADRVFAAAGLGGHLLAALAHALVLDSVPGGAVNASGLLAVAAVGAGAAVSARLAAEIDPLWRVGLDTLALALLGYLSVLALDGTVLTAAFAVQAVALTAVARRERDALAALGSLAFIGLATAHALAFDVLGDGGALLGIPVSGAGTLLAFPAGALLGVAAAGTAAAVSARLAAAVDPLWRIVLDSLALSLLALLTTLAFDGLALTAALAAASVLLAAVARRSRDELAATGALAFAGAALGYALAVQAPPGALLDGLAQPLAAAAALAAAAIAIAVAATLPFADGRIRTALTAIAAATGLYLASTELVTAAPGHAGQVLLSVLWALAGVGALVAGLLRDDGPLRRAALALLALTVAKVFLYDLASLTSLYRVGSLIGLGLLLLCGGFAWQRVRPLPLPDLRDAGADAA
jgi:uncharacterized membrane protein